MIQQILAIAGVDNMDEFHKKYPTKEKFLKAYPEASRLFEKHEQENFNPVAAYGGSMDHLDQMQYAKGGSVPQNAKLWSQAKALAKSKFDVYPSKYANNWAAKWYKSKGGSWRKAAYGGIMQAGGEVTLKDRMNHPNDSSHSAHEMNRLSGSLPRNAQSPIPIKPTGYELRPDHYMGKNEDRYKYSYADGGKLPREVLRARLESHMSPAEADDYLSEYAEGGTAMREQAKQKILEIIQKYSKMVGVPAQQIVDQLEKLEGHKASEILTKMAQQVAAAGDAGLSMDDESESENMEMAKYGGIHINPAKRGTFTAQATRMGMGVQEAARHILANKGKYSPAMIRKANFARNASKWKHEDGGYAGMYQEGGEAMPQEMMEAPQQQMQEQAMGQEQPQQGGSQDQMMQQLMQMVMQALQQGMQPEQIVQMLVQQGVPQEVAMQVIQMVMQQMGGGAPQGGPGQQYQPQGGQYQGPQAEQPQAAYGGMSDGIFYNESASPY